MGFIWIVLFTIIAYLIGSVPITVLIAKGYYGINIKDHGNGMASHSNVTLVMGAKAGWVSRILNIFKGFIAAELAFLLYQFFGLFSETTYPVLMLTFGLAALIGHIFSVFYGFKGGKGIHVTFGVLLAVHPTITLACAGIAILILLVSQYEYLSYLIAVFAYPVLVLLYKELYGDLLVPTLVFGVILFFILFFSLRVNIRNMLSGTETKAVLHTRRLRR